MNAIKKHSKKLSIILALAMIFGIFSIMPLATSAAEIDSTFTKDGLTYTVTGNTEGAYTVSVTGYDSVNPNVVIPSTVEDGGVTYTVTDIKGNTSVFRSNTTITSVNIPGTVTKISNYCFKDCSALATVTLNEGTEEIGSATFNNCPITEIEFPETIKKIGSKTFSGTKLKEVTLKNTSVSSSFNEIQTLKKINIYEIHTLIPSG